MFLMMPQLLGLLYEFPRRLLEEDNIHLDGTFCYGKINGVWKLYVQYTYNAV